MSETITKAMDDLRARRDHLRRELDQVESALAALEQLDASDDERPPDRQWASPLSRDVRSSDPETLEWVSLDRTVAIRRALAEAGGPMKRMRLVETLNGHGRLSDNPENVSATLSYMKQRGEVDNPSPGSWTLVE